MGKLLSTNEGDFNFRPEKYIDKNSVLDENKAFEDFKKTKDYKEGEDYVLSEGYNHRYGETFCYFSQIRQSIEHGGIIVRIEISCSEVSELLSHLSKIRSSVKVHADKIEGDSGVIYFDDNNCYGEHEVRIITS